MYCEVLYSHRKGKMLHILLLILKIAGIILALILGIVILMICIVLFVPVRYELAGKTEGDLGSVRGRLLITWFLRLVRVDVSYKEQKLKWRIRIAWIKRTGGQNKEETINEEDSAEETESEEAEEVSEENVETVEKPEEEKEDAKDRKIRTEKGRETEEPAEDRELKKGKRSEEGTWEREKNLEEVSQTEACRDSEASKEAQEDQESRKGIFGKIKSAIQGIIEKIKGIIRKIRDTLQNAGKKLRELGEKKDKILEFIHDETHVGALRKGKKEVFHLLKRLNPRRFMVDIRFGFEDPAVTGQVLAWLGILYPFMGDHVMITPDFEGHVFRGRADLKGKIFGYYFLLLCWNLLWSRNVRQTYKDIRNFKLNDQEESGYGRE